MFGNIASFSKGKGISKADIIEDGETECIRYGELYTIYNEVINSVKSKTNIPVEDLILSDKNDVIIPASGETQIDIARASCVIRKGIALGGDLNIIKSKLDGVYLAYYLNNPKKKEIAALAQGNSVVHLYSSQLKTLNINYPKQEEQTKIATFLTAIEKQIILLSKQKMQLELYKKGLMHKIFNQELRFKDENGEDFPKWEDKKLGDLCVIIMGQSPSSSSYNTNKIGIPLIQGNADIQNRLSFPRNWTTEKTKECKIGDLILTVRAPVGAVAKSIYNACIGRGVCAIRNNSYTNLEFIYQFLLDYETKWGSLEQGSTFTAVSGTEINKVKIYKPSLPEQTQIANFLSAIDNKINQCGFQIDESIEYKKSLLQILFI